MVHFHFFCRFQTVHIAWSKTNNILVFTLHVVDLCDVVWNNCFEAVIIHQALESLQGTLVGAIQIADMRIVIQTWSAVLRSRFLHLEKGRFGCRISFFMKISIPKLEVKLINIGGLYIAFIQRIKVFDRFVVIFLLIVIASDAK